MGKPPDVYVTGTGYSGTTFVIELAQALGLDVGAPLTHSLDHKKGFEWIPFKNFAQQTATLLGRKFEPECVNWVRVLPENEAIVRAQAGPVLADMEFPQIVKCPDYGQSVVLDLINPGMTVIVHRSMEKVAVAMKNQNFLALQRLSISELCDSIAMQLGVLMDNVIRHGRPYRIIEFPRVVDDVEYATEMLADILSPNDRLAFISKFNEVATPEEVHIR